MPASAWHLHTSDGLLLLSAPALVWQCASAACSCLCLAHGTGSGDCLFGTPCGVPMPAECPASSLWTHHRGTSLATTLTACLQGACGWCLPYKAGSLLFQGSGEASLAFLIQLLSASVKKRPAPAYCTSVRCPNASLDEQDITINLHIIVSRQTAQ